MNTVAKRQGMKRKLFFICPRNSGAIAKAGTLVLFCLQFQGSCGLRTSQPLTPCDPPPSSGQKESSTRTWGPQGPPWAAQPEDQMVPWCKREAEREAWWSCRAQVTCLEGCVLSQALGWGAAQAAQLSHSRAPPHTRHSAKHGGKQA